MPIKQPFGQFLKQQGKVLWPFLVGAGIWFTIITKVHASIPEEERKQSYYWKKAHPIEGGHGHGHGHH
eukprot:gene1080-1368_t